MKGVVIGVFVFIGVALVTRFVPYRVPPEELTRPPLKCSAADQARFDEEGFEIISQDPSCEALTKINKQYLQKIKPIFQVKCLMCHGRVDSVPLYAVIPPVSFLIRSDMTDAKKEMDMTFDFPFRGHGTPKEDLETLAKIIREDAMPPFQYELMHWQSSLSGSEKTIIMKWIGNSLHTLNQ